MLNIRKLIRSLSKFILASLLLALLVACDDKDGYVVEDGKVYFNDKDWWRGSQHTEIKLKPGEKFTVSLIDKHYAMDSLNVYFRGNKMLNASPGNLKIMRRNFISTMSSSYAISGQHVYLDGELVPKAQGASFSLFYRDNVSLDYARDTDDIFFLGRAIDGVDISSFEVIDIYWGKDRHRHYYKDIAFIPKDPDSFEIMNKPGFARDKDTLYHQGKVVPNFDPSTVQILGFGGGVIKDKFIGCYEFYEASGWTPVNMEQDGWRCNP